MQVAHVRGGKHGNDGGHGRIDGSTGLVAKSMSMTRIKRSLGDVLGWASEDPSGKNSTAVAKEEPNSDRGTPLVVRHDVVHVPLKNVRICRGHFRDILTTRRW